MSLGGLMVALALAGGSPDTVDWFGGGFVEYSLPHRLHSAAGACTKVEARASLEGSVLRIMARAPVGATRHRMVVVKGIANDVKLAPDKTTLRIDASLELDGQPIAHPVELILERIEEKRFKVSFQFAGSVLAHPVERLSLRLVRVDDMVRVKGTLLMESAP